MMELSTGHDTRQEGTFTSTSKSVAGSIMPEYTLHILLTQQLELSQLCGN